MCGLRKQVTEAKEGPLELRRKQARIYVLGNKEVGKALQTESTGERKGPEKAWACWRNSLAGSSVLRAFKGGVF